MIELKKKNLLRKNYNIKNYYKVNIGYISIYCIFKATNITTSSNHTYINFVNILCQF